MDISPVGTLTIPRTCGEIPCGKCETCVRRAMLHTASYVHRLANAEEDDPKAVLSDLLEALGLRQQRVPSSEK